jgi:ubiquinone/menaquinone biosynthesis C-methylase UbiE
MFATKSYWDEFYTTDQTHHFDLYCDWSALRPFVTAHFASIDQGDSILHIGNGSSRVPLQMAAAQFVAQQQIVLDISPVVQRQMAALAPAIAWIVADATAMPLRDASIGAAFDKGTLDSLIYEPHMARAYCAELVRVLRPGAPLLLIACNVLDGDPSSCDVFLRAHAWSRFERTLLAPADASGRTARWAFLLVKPTAA